MSSELIIPYCEFLPNTCSRVCSLYEIGHLEYTCSPMKIIKIKHLEKFALTIISLKPFFSVLNYLLINFATIIMDKASNQFLLSTMPYYYYADKNK